MTESNSFLHILRGDAIHFKDEEEETKEPSSITYSHGLIKIEDLHRCFQNTNQKCKSSDN